MYFKFLSRVSSAASSQEIALLVQAASGETAKAVSAVNEVSRDMVAVGEMSKLTDSLLQRISSSLEQQASAVEEINANLSGLNHIANSNVAFALQSRGNRSGHLRHGCAGRHNGQRNNYITDPHGLGKHHS